jgi:hypothetical protein
MDHLSIFFPFPLEMKGKNALNGFFTLAIAQ